jgi:hypothetical protein
LFLLFHGRVMLAYVDDHSRALAKSCEPGMYDSGGASYLSCSYGSCIPCSDGGICRGMLDVLRAKIRHALASIPQLTVVVLWLGASSLDTFGGPAYCGLCDPVRGLNGD